MRTICAIANNPCRDIIEGKRKLPPLVTVPYREFSAAPAKPSAPINPAAHCRPAVRAELTLEAALELFRASVPGVFSTMQAFEFCTAAGWFAPKDGYANIRYRLQTMADKKLGLVDATGEGRKRFWLFS